MDVGDNAVSISGGGGENVEIDSGSAVNLESNLESNFGFGIEGIGPNDWNWDSRSVFNSTKSRRKMRKKTIHTTPIPPFCINPWSTR